MTEKVNFLIGDDIKELPQYYQGIYVTIQITDELIDMLADKIEEKIKKKLATQPSPRYIIPETTDGSDIGWRDL